MNQIFVLCTKYINPVDKVNRHLYQLVRDRFQVGEKYTPAQIRDCIDAVFENYHHKKPGKNQTHLFRMLFDTGRRDREGRYQIREAMSFQQYCSRCDTSPLYINRV